MSSSAQALPPPASSAAGRRVLVVDDNVDAAELLGDVLRAHGHTVEVAFDPLGVMGLLEQFVPDVAIVDIGMPVMDGYELAARMRETRTGVECQLIALTGYGQPRDHDRSQKAGFSLHLVKPVDLQLLLDFLKGSSSADELAVKISPNAELRAEFGS